MPATEVLCARVSLDTFLFVRTKGGSSYVKYLLEKAQIDCPTIALTEDDEEEEDDEPTEILPPDWTPGKPSTQTEDREVGEGLLF